MQKLIVNLLLMLCLAVKISQSHQTKYTDDDEYYKKSPTKSSKTKTESFNEGKLTVTFEIKLMDNVFFHRI